MGIKKQVAAQTGTREKDWEFIDGPETGVGVEYWLYNEKEDLEAYVCDDQGVVSISVD